MCVSAEQSMMLIVRMTTTGVLSRAGLTLDEMDDMKMAVDEACNLMLIQKPCYRKLDIRYEYTDEYVEVSVRGKEMLEKMDDASDPAVLQEVIGCILESVADEVEMDSRADGGIECICARKRIPQNRRRIAL